MSKNTYIAVVHKFFVTSEGFEVVRLKATTEKEADLEAAVLYRDMNANWVQHAAVKVIRLENGEHLPRKLTLWERITGQLQPPTGEPAA